MQSVSNPGNPCSDIQCKKLTYRCVVNYRIPMTWHPEGNVTEWVSQSVAQWVGVKEKMKEKLTYRHATHLEMKVVIVDILVWLWLIMLIFFSVMYSDQREPFITSWRPQSIFGYRNDYQVALNKPVLQGAIGAPRTNWYNGRTDEVICWGLKFL